MDILKIKNELSTKSIYDIKLKVTFYARVSSEKDEQLNSLDNQIQYYSDLIKKNQNWSFVDGYIDEGISGISTNKRESFHRMIDDARNGLFDLVITKEISRFARNTLDSIQYTRELLKYGVGVFFQNDNINTFDGDGELRLTIMASIAQDELRKLSSRIRFGHAQAIKNGVVMGNSLIYGYVKKDKKLEIQEDEAEMIRNLFDLYSTGNYSMKQIEKIFYENGIRNRKGKLLSHTTMSEIIRNPKYKGFYAGGKVKIADMFTKKQIFLPQEDWVLYKDETGEIVPAIVSEEVWNKANEVLQKRSEDVKNRKNQCNHENLFTGKIYCEHCNAAFYRKASKDNHNNENSSWVCSKRIANGAKSCPTFTLKENELQAVLLDVFKNIDVDNGKSIDKYIEIFKTANQNTNAKNNIKKLKYNIDLEQKKISKLLEYNVNSKITDDEFMRMKLECNKKIEEFQSKISEFENSQAAVENFEKNLKEFKKILKTAHDKANGGFLTREFIKQYIDKIYVSAQDTDSNEKRMKLRIKIFSGEEFECEAKKIAGSSGNTSFTIWPPMLPACLEVRSPL